MLTYVHTYRDVSGHDVCRHSVELPRCLYRTAIAAVRDRLPCVPVTYDAADLLSAPVVCPQ